MEVSKVVTCFLKYGENVLIFRRSENASSYPRCWAGVSGFIEAGEEPYSRALKEIEEETGVKRAKVSLLRAGKPFKVKDRGKIWVVHPFLFETKTKKIRLDKEHTECKWIRVWELKKYRTVPGLERSLRSVFRK